MSGLASLFATIARSAVPGDADSWYQHKCGARVGVATRETQAGVHTMFYTDAAGNRVEACPHCCETIWAFDLRQV